MPAGGAGAGAGSGCGTGTAAAGLPETAGRHRRRRPGAGFRLTEYTPVMPDGTGNPANAAAVSVPASRFSKTWLWSRQDQAEGKLGLITGSSRHLMVIYSL